MFLQHLKCESEIILLYNILYLGRNKKVLTVYTWSQVSYCFKLRGKSVVTAVWKIDPAWKDGISSAGAKCSVKVEQNPEGNLKRLDLMALRGFLSTTAGSPLTHIQSNFCRWLTETLMKMMEKDKRQGRGCPVVYCHHPRSCLNIVVVLTLISHIYNLKSKCF